MSTIWTAKPRERVGFKAHQVVLPILGLGRSPWLIKVPYLREII